MNKIKVKTLLFSIFSIPLIGMCVLIYLSIDKLGLVNEQLDVVSNKLLPRVSLVEKINTATADLRIKESRHIMAKERKSVVNDIITKDTELLSLLIVDYEKLSFYPEEKVLLKEFKLELSNYLNIRDKLISISNSHNDDTAEKLYLGDSFESYKKY